MRLPVTPQLSTKDGISNKNARLTNTLKEAGQLGERAVLRPGLITAAVAETIGNGNGLVCYNQELVSIFGANLCAGTVTVAGSGAMSAVPSTGMRFILDLVYFSGTWYAFCDTTDSWGADYGIWTSADAITWNSVGSSLDFMVEGTMEVVSTALVGNGSFYDYDNDVETYVRVSISSSGTVTYTPHSLPAFRQLAYHAPYYYGVTYVGGTTLHFARSSDGTTCTVGDTSPASPGSPWKLRSYNGKLCYIDQKYTGFMLADTLYYQQSSDGLTWETPVEFGYGENTTAGALAVTSQGLFVNLLIDVGGMYESYIYHSTDGVTFTKRFAVTTAYADLMVEGGSLGFTLMWENNSTLYGVLEGSSTYPYSAPRLAYSEDWGYTWKFLTLTREITSLGYEGRSPVIANGITAFPSIEVISDGAEFRSGVTLLTTTAEAVHPVPLTSLTNSLYDCAQSPL